MTPIHGNNMTGTSSTASSSVAMNQVERVNGWSCPWHPLQFIAWFFLVFFAVVYFGTFVPHLPLEWRPAGYIIPGGIYVIHVLFHIFALSVDPADPNIRGGVLKREKAKFDRSLHRHVIENSHCYICQSEVGSRSKHCSVCNKCVSEFDHHCKWLNNCVGGRNYKLFIGCVASAFVEALLVFTVTLYLLVAYFADLIVLKNNAGGQLKLFIPVPDVAFVVFVGIIAAMLLLTLALLGHLLGFHIYLMCHKLSTYDFIVKQRELKAHHDDAESGRAHSTPRFKLKNNKVSPAIEVTDEDGRIKLSEGTQSEASVETPSKETAVKTIREVSSKASKNYRSYAGKELESTKYEDSTHNKPESHIVNLHASSSEESLKEIPYQPTAPQGVLRPPSDGSGPSTSSPSCNREIYDHRETAIPVLESNLVSESQVSEDSRTPRTQKKPQHVIIDIANENTENGPSEDIYNAAGPSSNEGAVKKKKKKRNVPLEGEQGQESDRLTPRRKKKRKPKAPAVEGQLPPLVLTGRPLPSLPTELVKEESPC